MYGASGPGTFYISNVTCYGSVDDCNYEDNFSDECLSGDYDYVVQCYNYKSMLYYCVLSIVYDEYFQFQIVCLERLGCLTHPLLSLMKGSRTSLDTQCSV